MLIAVVSLILSLKPRRLQNKVNELEILIKKHEIEKIEKGKGPCIDVRIIHVSGTDYLIKVWNCGTDIARNISVTWDKMDNILCTDFNKMPFDFLEPQKNFMGR